MMAKPRAGIRSVLSRRETPVLLLALVALAIAVAGFYRYEQRIAQVEALRGLAGDIERFSGTLSQLGRELGRGVEPGERTLRYIDREFDYFIQTLREGDAALGIDPLSEPFQADVERFASAWRGLQPSVSELARNLAAYHASQAAAGDLTETVERIKPHYEQLVSAVRQRSANSSVLATIQLVRLERTKVAARSLADLGPQSAPPAETLQSLVDEFLRGHRAMAEAGLSGEAAQAAQRAADEFTMLIEQSGIIGSHAEALSAFRTAVAGYLAQAQAVIRITEVVREHVLQELARIDSPPRLAYLAATAAALLLLLFLYLSMDSMRRRATDAGARDAKQQQAILELLDEITNLADGDLTVDVTVTEDFTGAIADSINYTVANMRSLVGTINNTSVEIAAAASSTQETARRMNDASERQTREIASASGVVARMSESLSEVATRAESLSAQAKTSVDVAHDGASTVGRTIQGMAALREQIQDTSKRIKRLGESSQEIGNITELINDIAEQTNTLALNASIQAAMAGEAGRGFAVVADEVQRLAERAASATRQIDTLVKTIQADTNEAIVSMERSTSNVVVSARAAEEAGQALTQMEATSQNLARLMGEIALAAREQSQRGEGVAGTMQVVREIADDTSHSAARTAEAVGELNILSEKLRQSVSGFKLPTDLY